MFTIQSDLCEILKSITPLVKSQKVSVSASKKNQKVVFSGFNSDTNILFFHQINSKVEEAKKLAVASDRIIPLVCGRKSTDIHFDYNGSSLNYRYRKSKGLVETHSYEAHERPDIKPDKTLTALVRQNFSLLTLKSVVDGTEIFMFVEEFEDYTQICVSDSDAYHAVIMKIMGKNKTNHKIAIPFTYVQNAIRTLKENIQMCSDDDNLYCYTKDQEKVSIIRFRNILDTRGITSEILSNARDSESEFSFKGSANLFDDILADYEVIKDPDRGGVISVYIKDGKLELKCETRHGSCQSKADKVEVTGSYSFNLPTKVLSDVLKLKGDVVFSLKKDMNIFSIKQKNKKEGIEVVYLITADKTMGTDVKI